MVSSEVHSERILVFFSALRSSVSSMRFKSLALSPLNSALTSNPSAAGLMEPFLMIIRSSTGFMADGVALLTFADNLNFFSGTNGQSSALVYRDFACASLSECSCPPVAQLLFGAS